MWIRCGNTFVNMEHVIKVVMTDNEKGENVCKLYSVGDLNNGPIKVIKPGKYLNLLDEESLFGNMVVHLTDGDE